MPKAVISVVVGTLFIVLRLATFCLWEWAMVLCYELRLSVPVTVTSILFYNRVS